MAQTPISQLTALAAAPASGDLLAIVDVSDTTQSANGTTKKITSANLFTSVTVTTALTVNGTADVNGTSTVTSNSAAALAVGRLGATTPAFTVDASTASQVAGLKVTGAGTGGTVAVVVTDSGSNANLTVNAKGSGTIGIGTVSTGIVTITPALTVGGALTVSGASVSVGTNPAQTGALRVPSGTTQGLYARNNANSGDLSVLTTNASDAVLFYGGSLTIASTGASTFSATATATRVIGGTDVASAVAKGVFGDGTYSSGTDAAITTITGSLTSVTNAAGTGTVINHKTQLLQSVATTGAAYASHNVAQATHTSGTVANLFGNDSVIYLTGAAGTTTRASAMLVQWLANNSAVATTLRGVDVNNLSISGGATVSTAVGVDVGTVTGATNNYAIRTQANDSLFNGSGSQLATGATVGFVQLPGMNGTPAGTPANVVTGANHIVIDTSALKIWVYIAGTWRFVSLT